MAISSSSALRLLTSKTNLSISTSSKLLPSTLKATVTHRRFTTGATISASASTSKSQHHQTLLEKLHLKAPFSSSPSPSPSSPQTISVYEINEGDRKSPAFLKLIKAPEKCLGDLVTFSNKLYSGDLSSRLGITAGMIMFIEKDEGGGDRYEAVYSFYFGKFGHVSVQGPYYSNVDSELAVTGGTGVFEGARGKVKLTNVAYPFKLFYTFDLKGIGRLPEELVGGEVVAPSPAVKPLTTSN